MAGVACALLLAPIAVRAQKVTLIAVGDINLSRGVERAMDARGSGYPFAAIKPELCKADIVFANLECCLANGGAPVPNKKWLFRGRPRAAKALRAAGIGLVTLANNHSLDYGREALGETVRSLREAGVAYVGGGMTVTEAHRLRIVKVRGVRVGFLAYLGLFPSAAPLRAGEPGVAMANPGDIARDVHAARPLVDFLVVAMHAGKEYTFRHTARQEAIAHAAVDAGADLVIGHHPHVVQDDEVYKGAPIYYSLGNFVFDPSPTFLRDRGRRWSAMLVATFELGKPVQTRLVDLLIVDRQPRLSGATATRSTGSTIR